MKYNEDWFTCYIFAEIKWQRLQKGFESLMNKNTTEQGKEMSNDSERIAGKKLLKELSLQPSIHSKSEPLVINTFEVFLGTFRYIY